MLTAAGERIDLPAGMSRSEQLAEMVRAGCEREWATCKNGLSVSRRRIAVEMPQAELTLRAELLRERSWRDGA